jgi:amidase
MGVYRQHVLPRWKMWAIVGALFVLFFGKWLFVRARRYFAHKRYAQIAEEHQKKQRTIIDTFIAAHSVPKKRLCEDILEASVTEIAANTKNGKWRVEDVVLAYCHSAVNVHQEINCLTEVMFESALERARELDSRKIKEGVLFGVPISVKDCVNMKGIPSSVGVFRWRDELMSANAPIIDQLLEAGAVPFCKTNVPQTMMCFECCNPLWGTTENPVLKGFTAGGSSGGEAALIGAGGSVLGIGSDIGGSLRIPAHFSGICALKPSCGRLPTKGSRAFRPASFLVHSVNGPMARCVDDLIPFMEATCSGASASLDVPLIPFKSLPVTNVKMKIGVVRHLPFLEALPPCVRAVDEVVAALEADGHTVVEFKFPFRTIDLVSLMYETISVDGAHYYQQNLRDEPIEEIFNPFMFLMTKSHLFLAFCAWLASSYPDKRPMRFLKSLGKKDAVAMLRMLADRNNFGEKMNAAWKEAGIEFLIMPGLACPATPHGAFPNVSFAGSYTFIWNLLDYVAGVVPVTIINAEKDKLVTLSSSSSDTNANSSIRLLEAELEHAYNAEKMAGLPVGVQIITPRYHEAEALRGMKIVESALQTHRQ